MNEKVKKARMPSPHELREGYLNSSFHKSFQQPLAVRTKEMDDPELLEQRQVGPSPWLSNHLRIFERLTWKELLHESLCERIKTYSFSRIILCEKFFRFRGLNP